jgi:hypothetical protein
LGSRIIVKIVMFENDVFLSSDWIRKLPVLQVLAAIIHMASSNNLDMDDMLLDAAVLGRVRVLLPDKEIITCR